MRKLLLRILILSLGTGTVSGQQDYGLRTPVYMIPNFHPASCGWLADFSTERNYCANSYFAHLDRVAEDSAYRFVISEVNNMIAMLNFRPERFEELRRGIKDGRIEPVNAMFLELSPNLSGGEAIVRMGVNGLRWQEEMLGYRPRFNWLIDITGMHEQMAQIGKGLGLEAQVYCRNNISGNLLHWAESPDGSTLLSISGGHYMNDPFTCTDKEGYLLPDSIIRQKAEPVKKQEIIRGNMKLKVPAWSPYLVLQGKGDYSIPPENPSYATDVRKKWKELFPNSELKFTTLSDYYDRISPALASDPGQIPTIKGGWPYSWLGFWLDNEVVKSKFRRCEHALQSAEMLASIGSLEGRIDYPAQDLYHAWLLLHLNTDRNTIWGAAGGMVFESERSWDVNDRFNWINSRTYQISSEILGSTGSGYITYFNPLNWKRSDPQYIELPLGRSLKEIPAQDTDGRVLFFPEMSSTTTASLKLKNGKTRGSKETQLPDIIRTRFYEISIDPESGEISRITLPNSGKTILEGGGNIIVAEQDPNQAYLHHQIPLKENRVETASTRNKKAEIRVEKGKLATFVEITTGLYGEGDVKQLITIYEDYPRVDFDLYLNDIPDRTMVSAEFPVLGGIKRIRRGIPYGFAEGSWPDPTEEHFSNVKGINPAIRWSDYQLDNGAAFALLDRGVTGREHFRDTVRLSLMVSSYKYFSYESNWLSGKGGHHFQYALVGYEGESMKNKIPQMAWEYNNPPIFGTSEQPILTDPFFSSGDNIILHSCQRIGDEVELRFAECLGQAGHAVFHINLPAKEARLTNFLGEGEELIQKNPDFSVPLKPQQIITLRIKVPESVTEIRPLCNWSPLVPESKREYLNSYNKSVVGHPPR